MPRTSDALLQAMADEIKKDLQSVTSRAIRCSTDPAVRAQLMAAASSYLFGIACAAQADATPGHSVALIAESMAADHVDSMVKDVDGAFYAG